MICKLCGTSYTSTECTLCGLKPHEYANVTSLDFGKYKGLAIEQVFYRDPGYLRWMIRQGAGTPVQRAKARLLFIGTSRNDVNDLILAKRQLTRRQAGREEAQTSVYPSQTNDSQNYPIILQGKYNASDLKPEKLQTRFRPGRIFIWGWSLVFLGIIVGLIMVNLEAKKVSSPDTTSSFPKPSTISNFSTTSKPTSTPGTLPETGYALVKASTEIRNAPYGQGNLIETTKDSGTVAWQSKTTDGEWYERAGGGWIANKDVARHCLLEEECIPPTSTIQNAPVPTASPTQIPIIDNEYILSSRGELTYPTDKCVIKGDVSFNTGEKIYHVPGQRYYDATVINPLYGERWFCSEQDAINNGWRKSKV